METAQRPADLTVTVFGAAGPTGHQVCLLALAAGYTVRAVSRRPDPLPLPKYPRLHQVQADAVTGDAVEAAIAGADAVLSVLGTSYQRGPVNVYSQGTRNIVQALRTVGRGRRLVAVSSGLTHEPPKVNPMADRILFPLLRNVVGRTLYADMRRMEEFLSQSPDIDWTVMRPGRLFNAPTLSPYRLDPDEPTRGFTSRLDLAAAMVAELDDAHIHRALAPTTARR